MKKIAFLILFIACSSLFAANTLTSLDIKGATGKVLANVEKRLNELQQLKPLSEMSLDELRTQTFKAIEPFGYFRANLEIKVINKNKISLFIHLGVSTLINSLQASLIEEGAHNPLLLKTLKQIPLHVGDPLIMDRYNQAKQDLINTAENLGYLHSSFKKAEILVDKDKNIAAITLIFDTGPLYYFGQAQFNPTNIDPNLLKRYLPFKYGEPYSTDQILKLNNSLSSSGYFSSVLVKPQITEDQTVPILIHLQPVSKYTYTLGGGYGTDTGVRGKAGLNIVPVNKQGHQFNALAQGSFIQNAVQAQYIIPGKNPVYDQYSLTGNFSNLNYTAGYSNALLLSLAHQHKLESFKRVLSLNSLYEGFHYTLQTNNYQYMLYPKAAYSFNKTTNPLFSPSGYSITLNGLGASHLTLSKISFLQTSIDAKAAFMIEPWRLRLYGHTIQGITATGNINQLPLSLALLLGGTDNLKAYSFNSIGPGRVITYTGFEIQKEIKKNWYVIGFADSGDVYNPIPQSTKYDAGGGLMWVSPIGPIKVGVAQPITNGLQRVGGSSPRLVVSMGPDL